MTRCSLLWRCVLLCFTTVEMHQQTDFCLITAQAKRVRKHETPGAEKGRMSPEAYRLCTTPNNAHVFHTKYCLRHTCCEQSTW